MGSPPAPRRGDAVMAPSSAPRDRYRLVGPSYDALTRLASGRAIHHCRLWALEAITAKSRVLFCGAGHGTDVVAARACGARVTVVELSSAMVAQLRRHLTAAGLQEGPELTVVEGDAFHWTESGYDVVVANFFLNVFPPDGEDAMRRHLCERLADDGTLVVGDFAFPRGGGVLGAMLGVVQRLHWLTALVFFRFVTGNAIKRLRDHEPRLVDDGWVLRRRRSFRVVGLPLYESSHYRRRPLRDHHA